MLKPMDAMPGPCDTNCLDCVRPVRACPSCSIRRYRSTKYCSNGPWSSWPTCWPVWWYFPCSLRSTVLPALYRRSHPIEVFHLSIVSYVSQWFHRLGWLAIWSEAVKMQKKQSSVSIRSLRLFECTGNYLEIWLHQATCRCNGRCCQWSSGTDARQIFGNIRCQTEWNRTIRFQLTVRVVHVEFEVRNVDETGILVDIHHVRIQTCQM